MNALSMRRVRLFFREAFVPGDRDPLDTLGLALLIAFTLGAPFLYGVHTAGRRTFIAIGGGAVMPEGNALLEAFSFAMTTVVFLSRARLRSIRPLAIPIAGLIALALFGVLQILPVGYGILEPIAPVNAEIYHETAQILTLFGISAAPSPRISIAPAETLETALLALSYLALFLSAASLLRTRARRRLFIGSLLLTGVFQIVLAVIREPLDSRVRGVFANTDHFAGYLEIAFTFAFGAMWAQVLAGSRAGDPVDRGDRFERRFLPLIGLVLVWSVLGVGIGLTESRGAILAAGVATVVLFALAPLHQRVHRRRRLVAGAALAFGAAASVLAATVGRRTFLRFLESDPREIGRDTRIALWKSSLAAWREFPYVGSGLGTFREAFRRVQTRDFSARVEQAHSDFLQLLVTGGVVGAILGVVVFGSLLLLLFNAWRRQRHREESAFALAGFGALLALVLHGLVDFNMSIPPIPATLACAAGAAWAAGRHR